MKYARACLTAIGIVAITAASGCEAMPLYRVRGHRKAGPPEYVGIDDVDFHGHSKTCWRNWDNAAWSTIECPLDCEVYTIPSVPNSTAPHLRMPDSGVPEIPPGETPETPTRADAIFGPQAGP